MSKSLPLPPSSDPKSPGSGQNPPWARQRNFSYASSPKTNSGSKPDDFNQEERAEVDSDPLYREIILEHWQNPQNYGVIENADIDVGGYNPLCGDQIRITAKAANGTITDIAFTAEGCAISKASASIFTDAIKGKTLPAIKALSDKDVLSGLGITLTPARTKCALLVYKTFKKSF